MRILLSAVNRIKSYRTILKYKLLYGKQFKCPWNARVMPTLRVRIDGGGTLKIDDYCSIRENVCINVTSGNVVIGSRVFINDFTCINARKSVTINGDTVIGQGVKIYDHDHDYKGSHMQDSFVCTPVIISNNVWIGSDAIILRGSNIGCHSVIGAKSIVKGSVDDHNLFYTYRKSHTERIVYRNEET